MLRKGFPLSKTIGDLIYHNLKRENESWIKYVNENKLFKDFSSFHKEQKQEESRRNSMTSLDEEHMKHTVEKEHKEAKFDRQIASTKASLSSVEDHENKRNSNTNNMSELQTSENDMRKGHILNTPTKLTDIKKTNHKYCPEIKENIVRNLSNELEEMKKGASGQQIEVNKVTQEIKQVENSLVKSNKKAQKNFALAMIILILIQLLSNYFCSDLISRISLL